MRRRIRYYSTYNRNVYQVHGSADIITEIKQTEMDRHRMESEIEERKWIDQWEDE